MTVCEIIWLLVKLYYCVTESLEVVSNGFESRVYDDIMNEGILLSTRPS